jgi:universal stress protein A
MAEEKLVGVADGYELLTRSGEPAAGILMAQADISADLIVMATHGRTGISHFFVGSVAERVVRESGCPVLTIRPD